MTRFDVWFPGVFPITNRKPYMFKHDMSSIIGFLKSCCTWFGVAMPSSPNNIWLVLLPIYCPLVCLSQFYISLWHRCPFTYLTLVTAGLGCFGGERYLPEASGCSLISVVHRGRVVIASVASSQQVKLVTHFWLRHCMCHFSFYRPAYTCLLLEQYFWVKQLLTSNETQAA